MSDAELRDTQKEFAGLLGRTRDAIPENPGPGWQHAILLLEAANAALEAEIASRQAPS
jgi:hypothetical protein